MRSIPAVVMGLIVSYALAWAAPVQAGVIIEATRVIYPAAEREVTVKLSNQGDAPVLVQAWMDNGDPKAAPDTIKVPFDLTPPMARMQPQAGQALRMMYNGAAMAQDKESLYWLNVYEIPSRAVGDERNMLQIALRSRIKVFYRPQGLAGSPADAAKALKWSLVRNPAGAGMALKAENASPYHVNFQELGVKTGNQTYGQAGNTRGGMVAPFASQLFAIKGLDSAPAQAQLVGSVINDFGGYEPLLQPLAP